MAVKEQIRDDKDDEEGEGEGEEGKKKGPKKPGVMKYVILGAVAIFVAVLGAQVAAPLLTKMISGGPETAANEEAVEEEAVVEEEPIPEEAPTEDTDVAALDPAIYTPLDPPFVVSFSDEAGGTRFLQLTLQAMARSDRTIDQIKRHAPAIRNSFLFLISAYKVEDLTTLEGKEKLRAEMLAAANAIMEKNTGAPGIEELYFTSLVIQ